ncbi:MAG: hypothetical protein ACO1Q7_03900 [Gemmatimonas sp.]
MSNDQQSFEAQVAAARLIAQEIINDLATERGAHAETCIMAAARMAGTILFRGFGLPTAGIEPGAPVFSDLADERGPMLAEVMNAALSGLGVAIDEQKIGGAADDAHAPLFTIVEMQQKLDDPIYAIAGSHGLHGEEAARACALATGLLIHQTSGVLDPSIGYGLAVYGFVEGTKTNPIPTSHQ